VTQDEVIGQVVDALVELGIAYMVAGSFASSLHGVPRMTQDADLVIDVDEPLALRLVARLQPDFYVTEEAAREAVRLHRMFNAIHFETGLKVDLVIKKPRPFSSEELRRRQVGKLGRRSVDFATAEDTVLTKLEWAKLGPPDEQRLHANGARRDRYMLSRSSYDTPADGAIYGQLDVVYDAGLRLRSDEIEYLRWRVQPRLRSSTALDPSESGRLGLPSGTHEP
jgi:hypothetical protein